MAIFDLLETKPLTKHLIHPKNVLLDEPKDLYRRENQPVKSLPAEVEEGALLDAGIIGATARVEPYDIASYTASIMMALTIGRGLPLRSGGKRLHYPVSRRKFMSQPLPTAPNLSAQQMIAWNDRTAQTWRLLVAEHPEVLAIPCDIFGVSTVGQLLQHIVAVETRYAERLAAAPETPFDAIPSSTAQEIFGAHDAAMAIIHAELAKPDDWDRKIQFQTLTMGLARASRKTVFFHAMMHSIRHYAQLATLVRQHGFKTSFPMDYLAMDIEKVEAD